MPKRPSCGAALRREPSFVKDLVRRQAAAGSLAPKPATGGRGRYLDAAAQAWLVAYVQQQPDATLAELNQA